MGAILKDLMKEARLILKVAYNKSKSPSMSTGDIQGMMDRMIT